MNFWSVNPGNRNVSGKLLNSGLILRAAKCLKTSEP